METYGLHFRVQPSHQKKQLPPPPPPPRVWFSVGDDDDDDDINHVEREIFRQAIKNKTLKDTEEQHKTALEEDPSVFEYDTVYDEMKRDDTYLRVQDLQERKPKYILKLINKSKERLLEQKIIRERKLAKERSKDDHLYADKDKFVTGAFKRQLAEWTDWSKKDFLCQLRDEKEDKSDTSDFYVNLWKNDSFGAEGAKSRKPEKEEKVTAGGISEVVPVIKLPQDSSRAKAVRQGCTTSSNSLEFLHAKLLVHTFAQETTVMDTSLHEKSSTEQPLTEADQPKSGYHKRNEDALAAAKDRFLARKRAKEQ